MTKNNIEYLYILEGTSSESSSPHSSNKVERKTITETDTNRVVSLSSNKKRSRKPSFSTMYKGPGGAVLPPHVISNLTQFQRKQKKGTIDVWWLYDGN